MIQRWRNLAAAALACAILSGCGHKAAEGTKATGEVLEGTVSDAMIATDQVHSEAPLAPHSANTADPASDKLKKKLDGKAAKSAAKPEAGSSSQTDPQPTPKPQPTVKPTPAASEPAQ